MATKDSVCSYCCENVNKDCPCEVTREKGAFIGWMVITSHFTVDREVTARFQQSPVFTKKMDALEYFVKMNEKQHNREGFQIKLKELYY